MNDEPAIKVTSLADVSGLEALADICSRRDVDLVAFGSIVRRLVQFRPSEGKRPHLFGLAPFLSDIDLYHTGPSKLTPTLLHEIRTRIPFAEYFRWELSSWDDLQEYRADEERLPVIPANKLRLGTRSRSGIRDEFGGLADVAKGTYRFLPSPFYARSRLWAAHRDSPLLHALFYAQLLCEARMAESVDRQPGWLTCREFLETADFAHERRALEENAYLRARFLYRLYAFCAACRSEEELNLVFGESAFGYVFERASPWLWAPFLLGRPGIVGQPPAFVSSYRILGDTFRLDPYFSRQNSEAPPDELWQKLNRTGRPLDQLFTHALPNLPSGHRCIVASPRFAVSAGKAPSAPTNEQIHLQLPLTEGESEGWQKAASDSLGVIAMLQASTAGDDEANSHACALALPATCYAFSFSLADGEHRMVAQIRVSFGQLLEAFPGLVREAGIRTDEFHVRLFVTGHE
jgi:hypothetical protein